MFKVGDKVKVFLKEEITKAKKKKSRATPGVLKLWKAIDGKLGIIIEIVSDDEIWVCGDRTQKRRMFNKDTLVKKQEP